MDDQLKSGTYKTAEDVVASALQARRKVTPVATAAVGDQREAVYEMLRFVEKNRTPLTGISVKELIHEGHRL